MKIVLSPESAASTFDCELRTQELGLGTMLDQKALLSAEAVVRQFFQRNGRIRRAKEDRLQKEGRAKYKKGAEMRLVLKSQAEVDLVKDALSQLDIKAGAPYSKARQIILPIYGKKVVARLQQIVASDTGADREKQ